MAELEEQALRLLNQVLEKRGIRPKPVNPLLEALNEMAPNRLNEADAENLLKILAAKGGKIVWGNEP